MKDKRSAFQLNYELLGVILFVAVLVGLSQTNIIAAGKNLLSNKPNQEMLNQFERLIGTIDNLQKDSVGYFPNNIDPVKYSLELVRKCSSSESSNCDPRAPKVCLVLKSKGKRIHCGYVADADFTSGEFLITSNIKITKSRNDIVSFERE